MRRPTLACHGGSNSPMTDYVSTSDARSTEQEYSAHRERLGRYGQSHVLAWWDRLSRPERCALLGQLRAIDLEQLRQLFSQRERTYTLPAAERIQPIPVIRLGGDVA